ncbi:MAG: hypothetical protein KNN16_14150 [Thermoflexus hugenholtzii]|jgi:hypothetical protein|uniref:hypothetical protein n=1 Tax=Thermoflexus TaxID=1495649 RepID=UPI001C77F01F|nr:MULTISPECIES: hypothetical protein [Thermoflexus]QWK10486.1 MAG: hypothetical protein KNN16_14150 [Thermoflexus hugenholtzii]
MAIRGLFVRNFRSIERVDCRSGARTYHSEAFLGALLAQVARGALRPADLACYFVERKDGVSVFTRQHVNERGQIEGGLRTFVEAELEDLRVFLGVPEASE